jgi:hypothetical protein
MFVPSLCQCETRSTEVFWLLSQSLLHLRFNLFVIGETSAPSSEPLYATNTSYLKQETFLYEYPLALSHFAHNAQQNTALL